MRYLKDIPNEHYKVGLYQWNGKYIVKFEAGGSYEQIYKIDETEFESTDELVSVLDEDFVKTISDRFRRMHIDTQESMKRNGVIF
ncbi:hypothetical protein [Persicitalea sp.]|uniref:hypothetical protein n=1 Tax=Persicitalea sp. TaxID=3100273 RepID=UPI0035938FF6